MSDLNNSHAGATSARQKYLSQLIGQLIRLDSERVGKLACASFLAQMTNRSNKGIDVHGHIPDVANDQCTAKRRCRGAILHGSRVAALAR
jgi:hypothetical protein